MKTHYLTRRRVRPGLRPRYATRMLHGRRPPRPTLVAACRALSSLIRLQSRFLDAWNTTAFLKTTRFPRSHLHWLRTFYHLHLDLVPLTRRKPKIGKETVNKR